MYLYNCRETFVKPVSLSPREGLETIFLSLCQIFYRNASQWELSTNWPHLMYSYPTMAELPVPIGLFLLLPLATLGYHLYSIQCQLNASSLHVPTYFTWVLFNLIHLTYSVVLLSDLFRQYFHLKLIISFWLYCHKYGLSRPEFLFPQLDC